MDLSTYTPPKNHLALVEATRRALRFYPELVTAENPLADTLHTISFMLTEGDPGLVVYAWGRQLAADVLLNIKGMDGDERLAKLTEAVEDCISIRDNEGTRDVAAFYTAERVALQVAIEREQAINPLPAPGTCGGE